MKTIEEQLVERLHDRANHARVQFGADDVRAPAAGVVPLSGPVRRHRGRLLAVAVVVVVVGGAAAYVASRSASTQLESGPAGQDGGGPDAAEETAVAVEELTITPTNEEPRRLSADGAVFVAEGVGNIEVGSPSETLLAEQSWLERARCVATATGVGCAPAEGVVAGSPPEAGHDIYGSHTGFGYHVTMAPSSPNGPFIFLEQNSSVIVGGLPEAAATVEANMGGQLFLQRPEAGTAAFPLSASVTSIRIQAHDAQGVLVWDSLAFDLPQPSEDDEPAEPTP